MGEGYALFDFDGTLIRGDSIVLLCRYARRRGLYGAGAMARTLLAALGFGLRLISANRAKETALAFLRGRSEAETDALAHDFCRDELLPRLRPEGLAALKAHRKAGRSVLLLTASPAFYLEPLRLSLGADAVIGTRMDVRDGAYTGRICGDNCKGLQKPLRLAEYLAAEGRRLDYDDSWAYGDSGSDLPMLKLCAHRVAVNPKPKLRKALRGMEGAACVRWAEPARAERGNKHGGL